MNDRWERVWQELAAPRISHEARDELVRAYSSPGRYYHNLIHVEDCLSMFDQTRSLARHPEEVELAIWFHDAVYDPRRNGNEEKSAAWAAKVVDESGLDPQIAERVAASILATRHDREVASPDARLLVDIDLSIFGRHPIAFRRYEEDVRKEYAWVPEDLFRRERLRILQHFLERPYIYYYDEFRENYEKQARMNLEQAVVRLGG